MTRESTVSSGDRAGLEGARRCGVGGVREAWDGWLARFGRGVRSRRGVLPRHGPTSMLRVPDEAGLSGPMAAIVCLLAALAMGLVLMVVMLGEAQRRAQAAADLGAISALQGGDPGADPCVTARTVVTENRAALDDCRADGTAGVKVSVSVAAPIVWMDTDWRVRARARAVNEAEYRGGS